MMLNTDRQNAAKWAYDLLQKRNWCVLDTETTGLANDDQICQIAIVSNDGQPLLNELVRPTIAISAQASAIHGITNEQVATAPSFDQLLIPILKAINNRDVVIYNEEFDLRMIRQSLRPYGVQLAFPTSDRRGCRIFLNGGSIHCAMQQFSAWVGEWNAYHGGYRWQRLPGGDHSAIGDCLATVLVVCNMAASYQPESIGDEV
jgi:DNA polymerase III subunit epsilon